MHSTKTLKTLTVFILIFSLLLLTGCTKKESLNATDLTTQIKSKALVSSLSSLSGDKLLSYFGFSERDVHRFSVLIGSSGETADTIAAFEVKNAEQRTAVITGIGKYSTKLSSLSNTIKAESAKIKNRLIYELNSIIILVICSNTSQVEKYLTELGATPIS